MKKFRLLAIVALIAGISACSSAPAETTPPPVSETTPAPEPEPAVIVDDNGMTADFTKGLEALSEKFELSNGWTNGSMFNCTWRSANGVFDENGMKLVIDEDPGSYNIPYSGGEFRTKDFYGYGMYEVTMKPIKNDGVVSSFFTYTGPSDKNPWDEIDIEFLGKDTTKVQFNYYTNGRGNHEHMHDLGFDASEDFHTYGFNWQEDSITWYVDGEEVYTADKKIPTTPGKIMMNVWPGIDVDSWLKAFDGTIPLSAEYKSMKYTAK